MERGCCYQLWLTLSLLLTKCDSSNKSGFYSADSNQNADANLPLKYKDRVGWWGVQIIQYHIETLCKKESDIIKNCGTDGHAALQLINLRLYPLHFLFPIDECHVILVQGTTDFTEYASNVDWHHK